MVNFLFHRVHPEKNKMWQPMHPAHFERCIKYIKKHFTIIEFENDFERVRSNEITSNTEFATIMFDDGYKDNFDYALPILKKHNCKASFYIVSNSITMGKPIWTYQIDELMANSNLPFIQLESEVHQEFKKLQLGENSNLNFKPYLKTLSQTERQTILTEVESKINDVELSNKMMSWQQVKELRQAGHGIGSHTANHPLLSTLLSQDEQVQELKQSKKAIENKLGGTINTIAYPNGDYNESTIKAAKQAGYNYGLAVNHQRFNPQNVNQYSIPRVELYQESWMKTKLRIHGVLQKVKSLKSKLINE